MTSFKKDHMKAERTRFFKVMLYIISKVGDGFMKRVINQMGSEPSAFDPKLNVEARTMTGFATTLLFRTLATLFTFLVLVGSH